MGDRVALERSGVVVVELLEALERGELRGADATFTTVGVAGVDLALEAGNQVLLERPALAAGRLGEALNAVAQRRGLQRAGQERDLVGVLGRVSHVERA